MIRHAGKRTLVLENRPRLLSHAAAVGKKEGEGPLGSRFDFVTKNDRLGQKSWELAESELQKTAIDLALRKGGLHRRDLDLILAGDLLNRVHARRRPLARAVRRVLDHGAGTCTRRRARRGWSCRAAVGFRVVAFLLRRAPVPLSPRLRRPAHPDRAMDGDRRRCGRPRRRGSVRCVPDARALRENGRARRQGRE